MGIQGLLPFLKKIHTPVNISQFAGSTVAIDAYCWLHKGAFSCAEKLALGEKTDQYVYYCMKYIDYMLKCNIKPILVFDGCHLKSKADVEKSRRERRELNRKKAAQFLREGRRSEARDCLQKCIDITPQMALNLMNACRDRGVDCIVAPYEADAQLAYLNLKGIAEIIVTEDSDLLLFGCQKIIFKMDFLGNGILIEQARLNEVLDIQGGFYSFEKFRYMCILSGCDYLPSLHGIGLAKACKVFRTARRIDIRQVLKNLPTYLKMNVCVTSDYVESFVRANNTFLYQLVFDPLKCELCPLNPYPPELNRNDLDYAGQYLPKDKAHQIALGNVDIHCHKPIANFDPETFVPKIPQRPKLRYELSIWNKRYLTKAECPGTEGLSQAAERPSLRGREAVVDTTLWRKRQRDSSTVLNTSAENQLESKRPRAESLKVTAVMDMLDATEETVDTASPNEETVDSASPKKPETISSPSKIFPGVPESDDDKESEMLNLEQNKNGKKSNSSVMLSAADIGEETFRLISEKENALQHSVFVPKNNIFAVPPDAEKPVKFDVNAVAVKVKSRYFSSPVNAKKSPSPKKTPKSNFPSRTENSSIDRSKRPSVEMSNIGLLFKKIVKHNETVNIEADHVPATTKITEKGSNPKKDSSSQSLLEMFKNMKDAKKCSTNPESDSVQAVNDLETSSAGCRPMSESPSISPLQQFRSSFEKPGGAVTSTGHVIDLTTQSRRSPGSAFCWSRFRMTPRESPKRRPTPSMPDNLENNDREDDCTELKSYSYGDYLVSLHDAK